LSSAIEDRIFDFLEESIAAIVDEDDPLFGAQLLDSPFAKIESEYGIQVDDGDSDFAPTPGATDIEEFDGRVTLIIFRLVTGADRSQRAEARGQAIAMSKAAAMFFLEDPTMGGRVNDSRVLRCSRGWASIKASHYSIMNVPLIVNETGTGGING